MSINVATQWTPAKSKLLLAVAIEPREIGRRIKLAREAKHWTQIQFAANASISPSSVARWEAGHLPPIRELIRIADVLGIDATELVEPPAPPPAPPAEALEEVKAQVADIVAELKRLSGRLDPLIAALDRQEQSAAGSSGRRSRR